MADKIISNAACVLSLAFIFIMGLGPLCSAGDAWTTGRATWFDVGPDMSKANCHFSWAPTGRNVGAWPDVQPGFGSSCGKCFEVRCRNADFMDGNGETLRRSSACYDESKSVIITIVDACPCQYPNNANSNRRWCCGDMNHLDISQEAFQQLADLNVGVIGLSYREVDCATTASAGNNGRPSSSSSDGGSNPTSSSQGDGNGNGKTSAKSNDNVNANNNGNGMSGSRGQQSWPNWQGSWGWGGW